MLEHSDYVIIKFTKRNRVNESSLHLLFLELLMSLETMLVRESSFGWNTLLYFTIFKVNHRTTIRTGITYKKIPL